MFNIQSQANVGSCNVITTNNRGHSPDEVARLCVDRIMSVSDTAPPAIRDQAPAFQQQLLKIIEHYIIVGINQDRLTVSQKLTEAGLDDLAKQIRRL